jgi:hypothetical protein
MESFPEWLNHWDSYGTGIQDWDIPGSKFFRSHHCNHFEMSMASNYESKDAVKSIRFLNFQTYWFIPKMPFWLKSNEFYSIKVRSAIIGITDEMHELSWNWWFCWDSWEQRFQPSKTKETNGIFIRQGVARDLCVSWIHVTLSNRNSFTGWRDRQSRIVLILDMVQISV